MVGRAPAGSRRLSVQELAAATPATRNRYADLLRVASIFVVVLGHWTMAVLSYHDGKFTGQNLLEIPPGRTSSPGSSRSCRSSSSSEGSRTRSPGDRRASGA